MQPMVNFAISAARNASRIIIRSMDHLDTIKITKKQRRDYATEVDKRSEQEIIKTIQKAYPDHAILAEESGEHKAENDYTWIIDPLDGTTNYIHGIPHFAISIAVKYKNTIQHACVFDPIRQELFTASKGEGAYLNAHRIRVSQHKTLDEALIGTGFPFRHHQHLKNYINTFQHIFPKTCGIRRAGAASLDLAYVAAGRLDGFWEFSLNPWDMAAGVLLVKEAGGLISDFHGEENYMQSGNIIAGNPKIFKALLQIIGPNLQN